MAGWYPSETNPIAGIYIKEHALAIALSHQVTVIYHDTSLKGNIKFSDKYEDGLRVIRFASSKILKLFRLSYIGYLWNMVKCYRYLRREKYKPDIIHCNVFFTSLPGVILGKLYRVPVVLSEHWSGFHTKEISWRARLLLKIGLNKVSMILPVSKALQKEMESYNIRNRFTVVPNTVNTSLFSPISRNNNRIKRILTVSGITKIKGIYYLIQAIAKVKNKRDDFILDIVGDGPMRGEYEELSKESGLDKIIVFHGLKLQTQVAEFMRNCDFVVIPSLWESFSCPLIQAFACGKPVIASNVGGIPELLNGMFGILVPSANIDTLAEAIEIMLDKYITYNTEAITQYGRENFGYQSVGRQLGQIYYDIKG
ncbi:MAG: glycosyltransferase [Planctomycetota bacterium]